MNVKNFEIGGNILKKVINEEGFFLRSAGIVAKNLLGSVLVRKINNKILRAKIVETEAYFDENDPASRACKNGDLRETMKMKAGTILVYGVHNNWLLNIVTGEKDKAEAVLIRALEPLNFDTNTKGPGLLTKAMGINKSLHKKSIFGEELWVEKRVMNEEIEIKKSFRIGLRKDLPEKLRFYIRENKYISRK